MIIQPAYLIQNISFSFQKKEVLRNLSMSIPNGGITGILGPNGSGKSTLVKVLAGHLSNYDGSVFHLGKNIANFSPSQWAEQRSYFGQFFSRNLLLTADELLDLNFSSQLQTVQYQEKKEEIMEALDLHSIKNTILSDLSGGQQQRVFISKTLLQALTKNSSQYSIILDEPFNNLDIRYQYLLMEYLETKAQEGYTIIIVLHDINLASQFCKHIAFLKEGKIIAFDTTNKILDENLIYEVFQQHVNIKKDEEQAYIHFKTKKHEHHSFI